MHENVLIQGFLVGLLTCAPLGPIGVLAARRTLTGGRLAGLFSLLGASTADGVYCAFVGLGIQAVSSLVGERKALFQVAAGLVLTVVGIRIFLARPRSTAPVHPIRGLVEAFTSTFLLVLANPLPALIFAAAFTALGIHGWGTDPVPTLFLVTGVFLGSAAWSPVMAAGATLFSLEFDSKKLRLMNRACGGLIAGIGLALGASAWMP